MSSTNVSQPREQFDPTPMVNKLSARFRATAKPIGFNNPNLRRLQTTFTYFVDDIQRGPVYDAAKQSVFVLHWIQRLDNLLKKAANDLGSFQSELDDLINTQYVHQNFHV